MLGTTHPPIDIFDLRTFYFWNRGIVDYESRIGFRSVNQGIDFNVFVKSVNSVTK